jgi:hypothetical protein
MPDQTVTILDGKKTFWRWISISRPAVLVAEPGATQRTTLANKQLDAKLADRVSPEVPAGWTEVPFDDAGWPRTNVERLPWLAFMPDGYASCREALLNTGLLCLRGKFEVTDPATVHLSLALKYRGGVVVYLNGQEVARGGLPAGAITAATPADPYPDEAWVDASGKLLPGPEQIKGNKEIIGRIASRDRVLGPVVLSAKALRKGVNVLALEIHRSDYHPKALSQYLRPPWEPGGAAAWTPCALTELRLAADGGGATPNCARPAGVQVWNQDRNDRTSGYDYGDPNEKIQPIVLSGARNGVFSGKVVVSSDKALRAVKAEAGELKHLGGKGIVPDAALRVQYAEPFTLDSWPRRWAEPMGPSAPDKVELPVMWDKKVVPGTGAVLAIWLSVRVPKDAAPGDYTGTMAVSVAGAKVADVPVRLHVADWTVPDTKDFRTFVGLFQSATTLALQYNVPEWSDKHWELMERSMDLLGQLGNQMVHVPVVEKTRLGNEEGMVTWIKKPDGTFDYDYAVVERYLKLVKKHMGVPKFVVLHVFQPGGWGPQKPKQENTVTVLDPKTGQREHLQVPEFGTEESKKFWTPVLMGLKGCLAKEGMEKSLVLGQVCEGEATPAEHKVFSDILGPDVHWLRTGHRGRQLDGKDLRIPGGGKKLPFIFTYLPALPDPQGPIVPVHKPFWPLVAYYRVTGIQSLLAHRQFALGALYRCLPGFAYGTLDFWPVIKTGSEPARWLFGRWPRDGGYPGDPFPYFLTWPGPNGAEPMTIYEAVREGLQEAEALVVVSEAMDHSGDKLGPELTARCGQALRDELAFCVNRDAAKYQCTFYHMNHYGWQELSQRVFTLAGEVTAKAGK